MLARSRRLRACSGASRNGGAWLDAKGIEHRPGRGFYEVMQLKHGGGWPAIFTRAYAPEHVSVPKTLWPLVRSFLRERSGS